VNEARLPSALSSFIEVPFAAEPDRAALALKFLIVSVSAVPIAGRLMP
jgi:hypothetical protein